MASITPLLRTAEISVHRFTHPAEHEDQPYEEVASAFMASFVEDGAFNLCVGDDGWRVGAGDVMLSRPGMRFRASFDGAGFNDTCLSLTYLAPADDAFGACDKWIGARRPVLAANNRLRYLQWGLRRAVDAGTPMFAEYCASEIFREAPDPARTINVSARKFSWYAERIDHARQLLGADLDKELTASALARSVGMSMFHFTRLFGALVGMPPHQYRLKARLAAAKEMLREGRGVTETCYACGFQNLSHFSRSFARAYGAPPSRVRG
ncbi:MAG: hypothetical protein A3E78_13230 [Alphaproteobacteria bacterium RIFCSPHIGHO2_12_FULL_63_12]|nr:MAG: hypothetical protein A3E78_13230 [Alphaproteobacteria bacterium RIFCSPHIGHO2_12_FULL_63_12]